MKTSQKDFDFQQFVRILSEEKPSQLVLTGGEALLHEDFEKCVEVAYDRGIEVALFTNGLLLDSNVIDFLLRYHVFLQVSYPTPCGALLKKLLHAREEGIRILTSTIFLKRTLNVLDRVLEDVLPFEANMFLYPMPLNKIREEDVVSADDWDVMIKRLISSSQKIGNHIYYEKSFIQRKDLEFFRKKYACSIGDPSVKFFDTDGAVRLCCLMSDLPKEMHSYDGKIGCPALIQKYGYDPRRCSDFWVPVCPLVSVSPDEDAFAYGAV